MLALERPSEIREGVEVGGVGHIFGEYTPVAEAFASPLYPVAQQILAKGHTMLLPEDAAELGGLSPFRYTQVGIRLPVEATATAKSLIHKDSRELQSSHGKIFCRL